MAVACRGALETSTRVTQCSTTGLPPAIAVAISGGTCGGRASALATTTSAGTPVGSGDVGSMTALTSARTMRSCISFVVVAHGRVVVASAGPGAPAGAPGSRGQLKKTFVVEASGDTVVVGLGAGVVTIVTVGTGGNVVSRRNVRPLAAGFTRANGLRIVDRGVSVGAPLVVKRVVEEKRSCSNGGGAVTSLTPGTALTGSGVEVAATRSAESTERGITVTGAGGGGCFNSSSSTSGMATVVDSVSGKGSSMLGGSITGHSGHPAGTGGSAPARRLGSRREAAPKEGERRAGRPSDLPPGA